MSLGKITREEQHFFINTGQVFGVQSVQATINLPTLPLKYIGFTSGSYVSNGPKIAEFTISQFLITDDVFLQYTGDFGFDGYLLRSRTDFSKNYSFKSGYLTNYAVKCSVGAAIEVSATINAYVDAGNLDTADIPSQITNSSSSFPLKIADPRSIEINIDEFNTNRVTSFDIGIACNRFPIYILGSGSPLDIRSQYPFDTSVKFQFEVDDYSGIKMSNFPCNRDVRNLSIQVKDFESSAVISNYEFKNMTKISEAYSSNVEGVSTMSIEYRGFINR